MITEGPANKTYYVLFGKSRTFSCRATGVPTPKITWHKDGIPVQNGEGVSVSRDGTLQLTEAFKNQSGMYTCFAENLASTVYSNATIEVFRKKFFTKPLVI